MIAPRFVRWLVLFAALWLPLQAVAGLAMPYCKHGAPQLQQQGDSDTHCEHADKLAKSQQGHGLQSCDNCGLCHLAGTSAIPLSSLVPAGLPAAQDYALPAERPLVSHIPELPQRPPRPLA